jgi:HAD superfamily hydrolase (TIGR01484 family)
MRSVTAKGRELTVNYHEPEPESIGALQNILDEMPIHKLMAVKPGEPRRIKALQWQLDKQMDGKLTLIQIHNIPDTLEILPANSGKAVALKVLLKQLGISAEETLAIGDGENDIEMIKLVGVGVAVGNATQSLKDVANHVVASNDDDGVAEAVERFVLKESATVATETASEEKSE